jgi:hypothetical protein
MVRAGRRRLVVVAGMVACVLAAGTVATGTADAAATPLRVGLGVCGTGWSAFWNSTPDPVLVPGPGNAEPCSTKVSSADPAFARMYVDGTAGLAVPTIEPTFTASMSGPGPTPRMVINLSNGQSLAGYPGLALAGQSSPDAAGMAWAVGDSTTYTDYKTAYGTAGASSATVHGQAYVEADADPVAGTATTVTSAQYGGNLLGAGTVTVSVPGPQTALIGSSIILSVEALTTSSDNKPPTISVTGLPDGLTLAGNRITGTLAADARSGAATVTATDVYGQVGTATISFTLIPAPPVLSHGKAVATSPTREKVTWQQTIPSWEEFVIVGPGAINGHVGWVPPGTQVAYYSGLEAHHGYTVTYWPYTAKNGTLIPYALPGSVYFVS